MGPCAPPRAGWGNVLEWGDFMSRGGVGDGESGALARILTMIRPGHYNEQTDEGDLTRYKWRWPIPVISTHLEPHLSLLHLQS